MSASRGRDLGEWDMSCCVGLVGDQDVGCVTWMKVAWVGWKTYEKIMFGVLEYHID
jgi:hypothetical protein